MYSQPGNDGADRSAHLSTRGPWFRSMNTVKPKLKQIDVAHHGRPPRRGSALFKRHTRESLHKCFIDGLRRQAVFGLCSVFGCSRNKQKSGMSQQNGYPPENVCSSFNGEKCSMRGPYTDSSRNGAGRFNIPGRLRTKAILAPETVPHFQLPP